MSSKSSSVQISASPNLELDRNLVERVCVGDIISRLSDLYPERLAIIDGERCINYREFNEQANRLGHALLALGLASQDVVAVMSRNTAELLISYFACAKAGLICAPVNLALSGAEITYCLRDTRARVLIVDSVLADAAKTLPEHLPDLHHVYWTGGCAYADLPKSAGTFDALVASGAQSELAVVIKDRDAVQLLYTSGITASPKGVLTSHLAVTITTLSVNLVKKFEPGSKVLCILPLFHCAQLNAITLPALVAGATVVLMQSFDPSLAGDLIEQHQVKTVFMLPMMYGALLAESADKGRDFSSVTRAIYGMAPMSRERLEAIHTLLPNADVVLGSGQTEYTSLTCFQLPEYQWDNRAASWGVAMSMTRVSIIDDDGNLLPRGKTGEIVYRGPQAMNCYLNLPEQTAQNFKYGWFHSGDIGWMDEEGVIWFIDRKKDLIKTAGENVASIEVELCLLSHPHVVDAAVVGMPHAHWGEAVTAAVVLAVGVDVSEEALIEYCRQHLARFKVPKAVRMMNEFPRTGSGKIQKYILRTQLQGIYSDNED